MDYLQNVRFNLIPEFNSQVKQKILAPLIENLKLGTLKSIIKYYVKDVCVSFNEGSWTTLKKNCVKDCEKQAKYEIESTAYNLKCIADSMIPNKGLFFNFDVFYLDRITGIWKDDKQYFDIINPEPYKDPRLIFAFGPSGCGKTDWSNKIISILSSVSEYPSRFLSINETNYRNCSIVYNAINSTAKELCYEGFENLSLSEFSFFKKSIFDFKKVKKNIINYLQTQKRISLYVSDSLVHCNSKSIFSSCNSFINKFVDITRDKEYIAFLVYQHETGDKCELSEIYKCVGCLESGIKKQKIQGKKFISKYYKKSMNNSLAQINKAPFRFIIHNSGRPAYVSIIRDENKNKKNIFSSLIKLNQNRFNYTYNIEK